MNISAMRFFDRVLGIPCCVALTFARKLVLRAPNEEAEPPKKVLFIKLAEQGSTVLAYQALKLATDRYGAENVYFLVFEENRFILDALEVVPVDNVIAIRTNGLLDVISGALGALKKVRRIGMDGAVDLEFFARSTAVLSFLTGARVRVGYHSFHGEGPYRGDLMTHRLFFNNHLHTTDAFQVLVEALEQPEAKMPAFDSDIRLEFGRMDYGGPVKTRFIMEPHDEDYPEFKVTQGEKHAVRDLLKKAAGEKVDGAPIVLLNANCSDIIPLRRWPEENYIELAHRLLDAHPDLFIALTGGPDEAEGAAAVVNKIDRERCFSMAGRTTLRDLLVLYHLSRVLVTNDSGPAHFASLTPVNAVVLFGPETPALFGSRSSRCRLLWAATAFTPCVSALNDRQAPSDDNDCMRGIPVEDVFLTVEDLLSARGGDKASSAGKRPATSRKKDKTTETVA